MKEGLKEVEDEIEFLQEDEQKLFIS